MEVLANLPIFDANLKEFVFSSFDESLVLITSVDKDIALFDIKSVKQIAHLKLEADAK